MTGIPGYDGWVLQIDPPAVAINRAMLDLNDGVLSVGGSSGGAVLDWGTSSITEYLAQQGQYGSSVADYVIPNRTITIPLGIGMDQSGADPEAALRQLSEKVGLLFREGGWFLRQRYDSATGSYGPPLYADVVSATLDVPDAWLETGGVEPGVTLTLECLPDFYGDPVTLDTISCTGICDAVLAQSGEPAVIPGDYPARCCIEITSESELAQYGAFWGFRSRHYNSAQFASLVWPASSTGVVCYGASTKTTLAGSMSSEVARCTLIDGDPQSLVLLSGIELVGTYAVWVRCYFTGGTNVLLQMQQYTSNGDFPLGPISSPVKPPEALNFYTLPLGTVTFQANPIDHTATNSLYLIMQGEGSGSTDYLSIDTVWFQPLDESAGYAVTLGDVGAIDLVAPESPSQARFDGFYANNYSVWQGPLPIIGDLPRLPPSGMEGRPCELITKISRSDFGTLSDASDDGIDRFTVTVTYNPCYMTRI